MSASGTRRMAILLGAVAATLIGAGHAAAQGASAKLMPNLTGKILTVRGPIDPAAAGTTLMHEHIFINFRAPASVAGDPPAAASAGPSVPAGEAQAAKQARGPAMKGLDDYGVQLAEVVEFRKAGGATIVDVTNFGLTRRPEWLRRVSEESGLNVVMGAGWYMRSLHPPDMDSRTVEELTDILVHDITLGAQGTDVRSGIIGEVGVGAFGPPIPLTPNEIKSVRASARASRLTGAPISIHSFASPDEMQRVLDIIASEGVDLNHVVLSHTGRGDLAAMKRYTDRGAYIEFDYLGSVNGPDGGPTLAQSAQALASKVKTLIDSGLGDRILVAQDVCTQPQLKQNGGGGYAYISTQVVPALKALGVSDAAIAKILVENPARVLTFVAPQAPVAAN